MENDTMYYIFRQRYFGGENNNTEFLRFTALDAKNDFSWGITTIGVSRKRADELNHREPPPHCPLFSQIEKNSLGWNVFKASEEVMA